MLSLYGGGGWWACNRTVYVPLLDGTAEQHAGEEGTSFVVGGWGAHNFLHVVVTYDH